MKVNTLKLTHDNYPQSLRDIEAAPRQLFWAGQSFEELAKKPAVAVVGSRKASAYGKQVTEELVSKLVRAGVVIISGLALGIDSIAHRAALNSGGQTIAVLPSGLDKIYPAGHYQLARGILRNGALISEYSKGTIAYKQNFIERNRIVSGLASGLLITEAAASSGTMHTARFALEQAKTVMAVPGNITSQTSAGCNNLIKSGALAVTCAEDIFFALNIKPAETQPTRVFKGNKDEQLLFNLIRDGKHGQEELASASRLDPWQIASILTTLEINGYIKPIGAGNWVVA